MSARRSVPINAAHADIGSSSDARHSPHGPRGSRCANRVARRDTCAHLSPNVSTLSSALRPSVVTNHLRDPTMTSRRHLPRESSRALVLLFALVISPWPAAAAGPPVAAGPPASRVPPNILLIILDDVGIDQMRIFGYGGTPADSGAPRTADIDTIAREGVRFRNTWAMPECSPSRALLFEGRYPFRTNVYTALTSQDLANSRSEEHTSELQSHSDLVCRLLLEKKKKKIENTIA